jgi:argininosuccinate lyase
MKTWGGRFREPPDPLAADFTRSIEVDLELALVDITGSIAHVHGLRHAGLLTADEAATLERGLEALAADVRAGTLAWDPALEDVHMNLEQALHVRVGAVAASFTPGARATTRSPPTSDCGSARRSTASMRRSWP